MGKVERNFLKLPHYLNVLFFTLVLFVEPAIIPQNLMLFTQISTTVSLNYTVPQCCCSPGF